MDGWMDEWMYGWMDRWMDGWMVFINFSRGTSFYGGVDSSVHHEGGSHYVILLF